MKTFLLLAALVVSAAHTFAQTKEVFLIGTMHGVPKIAANSYKPLLKIALDYQPEAIYVERVRPDDTLSLQNYTPDFLAFSDSLRQHFTVDPKKMADLMATDLAALQKSDFAYLMNSYVVQRDYANYHFYRYLYRYGIAGSKKPLRNENDDLTARLAIARNIRYIHAMDDQHTTEEYEEAWSACREVSRKNGDRKIGNKLNAKDNRKTFFRNIFGGLGKYNNRAESLDLMHQLNSFRYVTQQTEACSEGTRLWDGRNFRMATHIAEQVRANNYTRNVVVVGAGHILGLKEQLTQHYPDIKVKLLDEE